MAVTSLWRVRGYIGKVLLYAENPDKTTNPETIPSVPDVNREALEDVIAYAGREAATNQRQLVTGVNCTAETARSEMIAVKKRFRKEDGTIAYHGYQSFREGEVTPEQAHRIGIRLAEELWGERYQVLVATHVDKESHIHSHFVINTVSFVDGRKFYRSNEDYARMREVSDRLCREYGLSVVRRLEGRREIYSAWSAEKNGKPTNRSLIRADIDRAIAASLTAAEFFQTLADIHGGRLPVHVHFLMDEFANVALPDEFDKLLSTMRSREISVSIIIQNLAQLKALFEKQWESIVGNCDEFLYLGGNEQSTHEYVSKLLGKETIDTNSYGQSKGRNGSYSTNWQLAGRELMTPDEVRRLDNRYALLFIRGERPVEDLKFDILKHPNIALTADGGAGPYRHGEDSISIAALSIDEGLLKKAGAEPVSEDEYLFFCEEELEELLQKKTEEKQHEQENQEQD